MCLGPLSIYRCRVYIYVIYTGNREPRHHATALTLSYAHIHTHIHIQIRVHSHMHAHVCENIRTHTHIHIYIHNGFFVYVDIRTHVHKRPPSRRHLFHGSDNTLQHATRHFITLQHTATQTATHCIILHQIAPHCATLHHTATHCNTLQHTATHCITLQHVAIHCNALQDRRALHIWPLAIQSGTSCMDEVLPTRRDGTCTRRRTYICICTYTYKALYRQTCEQNTNICISRIRHQTSIDSTTYILDLACCFTAEAKSYFTANMVLLTNMCFTLHNGYRLQLVMSYSAMRFFR